MPDKAELKRQRAQSHRDKARNRREAEEGEKAETQRRRAQSQRDRARNRRVEESISRLARSIQQQLAVDRQPNPPAAVPESEPSTISLVTIMEGRSAKFMQNIARYLPSRLTQHYLTCIECSMIRNTPMLRS
jgi:hypothetical protein